MTRRFLAGLLIAIIVAALSWVGIATLSKPSSVILGNQEKIRLLTLKGDVILVAKIDTGSTYSSIDNTLARSLGLEPTGEKITIITGDRSEVRDTVKLDFVLANRHITTIANLADRSVFSTNMIIGKEDLTGFLIDSSREFLTEPSEKASQPVFPFSGTGVFGGDNAERLAKVIITVPILGTVIVLLRLLVGIRTFGMFAPVVIALSMLDLNIITGVLIYVLLITVGIGAKILVLNRLQLPNIAELAMVIAILVLVLLGVSALPFNFIPPFSDVFFRLIITTFIIEQASRIAEEHRVIDTLPLLAATFVTAIVLAYYGAFLLTQPTAVVWGFFAVSIFAIVIAGNYLGLRLSELVRFKFLKASHVHK